MGENENIGDKTLDKVSDSKGTDFAVARDEASAGMKDLADNTKDYYAARKGGMRDKYTMEHLGAQPEFFDSSMAANRIGGNGDAKGGDVHRNASGQPDKVTYPNGDSATIRYDKDHNPTEVKNGDGSRVTKDADGNGWTRYDRNGKKGDHLDGDVTVDNDGTITARGKDGFKEVERPDGSSQTTYPDKTVVEEKGGKVDSVTRPDGSKSEVKYGPDGKPSEITNVDGEHTYKKENGKWNVYDADGNKSDSGMSDVSVNDKGDVVMKGTGGSGLPLERTIHPNGDEDTKYPHKDGSSTTYHSKRDATGLHPDGTTTNFKDGSRTETKEDGSSTHYDRNGVVTDTTAAPSSKDWHLDPSQGDMNPKRPVYYENGEKDRMKVNPDGSKEITYNSDGRTEKIEKGVSTTTWTGQRGHLRVYPDGRREDTRPF